MAMASSSDAQIKREIERLTATINQHKLQGGPPPQSHYPSTRTNAYVNPNYKPPSNKYIRPGLKPTSASRPPSQPPVPPARQATPSATPQVKEVVLGGVAFESSGRSLVRKDLPKPVSSGLPKPPPGRTQIQQPYIRKSGHLVPSRRSYKPKTRRGGPNMTLNNTRRPYQSRRTANKRKYSDKPCPRFTTTGACSRGLTCMYQHDPSKIAICWKFLQGQCPNTAETCALSHDPTPERTPLCLHFLNQGRCTRENCPFPHVNVGPRQGICRDFAVLGYCEKGLECDKQHVRECPDFAEEGECTTKGCKLPHVIRANRNRKPPPSSSSTTEKSGSGTSFANPAAGQFISDITDSKVSRPPQVTAENAQLGDEYISLTFNESESEEDDVEEEESEEEEEEDEEGDDPNDNEDIEIAT